MLRLEIPRGVVFTGIVKRKILCHCVVFASRVFASGVYDSPTAFLEQRLSRAWLLADVPEEMHSIPTRFQLRELVVPPGIGNSGTYVMHASVQFLLRLAACFLTREDLGTGLVFKRLEKYGSIHDGFSSFTQRAPYCGWLALGSHIAYQSNHEKSESYSPSRYLHSRLPDDTVWTFGSMLDREVFRVNARRVNSGSSRRCLKIREHRTTGKFAGHLLVSGTSQWLAKIAITPTTDPLGNSFGANA
jgi:hypothetical protein